MSALDRNLCEIVECPSCAEQNGVISERVLAFQDSRLARKSHFFAGRFENVYLPAEQIPQLQHILDQALEHAANILQMDRRTLRLGFWFNIMRAGDVTLAHTHDDDDELLSGTYYLQVPPGSGALILHLPDGARSIAPQAGRFVLFHPGVAHEVLAHQSDTPRISLGFNVGAPYRQA